jgi:hypothetical protein
MTDAQIWSIYFGGIVSMRCHPANNEIDDINLGKYAYLADQMLILYRKRYP